LRFGERIRINTKEIHNWNWKLWIWTLLCALFIFSAVPVARSFQKFVYNTVGKEFFTYFVLSVILCCLSVLLYYLIFKFKVKTTSQYVWLLICGGLYVYSTLRLRQHPEEAFHLLEYGLLAFLTYRALSHRIQDWTIYITSVILASCVGVADEFIQWLLPSRYWSYKDVGINSLAAAILVFAIWKGIKPKVINTQVQKISVKMLRWSATVLLILMGLCLSNTPAAVNKYTSPVTILSWLNDEENMSEFGYKYFDPEIGTFYSRMTLEELEQIDRKRGKTYGNLFVHDIRSDDEFQKLLDVYQPHTNAFLHEFLLHIHRRNKNFTDYSETSESNGEASELLNTVFKENLLVAKYFGTTLRNSGFVWPESRIIDVKKTASSWSGHYTSDVGRLITSFSQKTALLVIFFLLLVVWTLGKKWERSLEN
jgi:VanZ family protein